MEGQSRCLIVGAGFSRAVSPRMPLTDELGQLVLNELRDEGIGSHPTFSGGYFEAWLSRLAEPQPDLADDANLHNQAWFSRITEEARAVLAKRQDEVLSGSAPGWLLRLAGLCHSSRSTIVTFNYDLLVEAALNSTGVYDWQQRQRPNPWHLVRNLPAEPVRAGTFAHSPADTFRLIKLHGSLDCWWVSGDATGATIQRDHGWPAFDRGEQENAAARPPGLVPFMVPPASAKSRFYANPITRALWQAAAAAIGEANTVDLIGYSLPTTDLVATGMLSDRLRRRDVKVRVVNPSPEAPIAALAACGVGADALVVGLDDYVAAWEADLATAAWDQLDALDDDWPVLLGDNPANLEAVVVAHDGELATEHPIPWAMPTRRRNVGDPLPVTVGDLRQRSRRGEPLNIRDDGVPRAVICWRTHVEETGHSTSWAVAVTSWSPKRQR